MFDSYKTLRQFLPQRTQRTRSFKAEMQRIWKGDIKTGSDPINFSINSLVNQPFRQSRSDLVSLPACLVLFANLLKEIVKIKTMTKLSEM